MELLLKNLTAAEMGRYYFIADINDKFFYGIPREN